MSKWDIYKINISGKFSNFKFTVPRILYLKLKIMYKKGSLQDTNPKHSFYEPNIIPILT
jgi:hypothetical protein